MLNEPFLSLPQRPIARYYCQGEEDREWGEEGGIMVLEAVGTAVRKLALMVD